MQITGAKAAQAGYTLIELAISLMIVGLLIAPAALIYSNYRKNTAYQETYQNVQAVVDLLQNFKNSYGYYPCPGGLDVAPSSILYGSSQDCLNGPIGGLAPGNCINGVCAEQSIRPTMGNIIVGAVPFRVLQMNEKQAYDGYGSRLVYAVTASMTSLNTFDQSKGGISVHGGNGRSLTEVDGNASYVVLSMGPDRKGAYSAEGVLQEPCDNTMLEGANCNDRFFGGAGTTPVQSQYVSSYENHQQGPNFFDDQISYFSQISSELWRRTDANAENINDLSQKNVTFGGTSANDDLVISSLSSQTDSLRTTESVKANSIWDTSHTYELNPAVLANGNMKCLNSADFVQNISNSKVQCGQIAVECPEATPVLLGVNPDGSLICIAQSASSCAATTRTACGGINIAVPARPDGGVFNAAVVGACANNSFTCNNGTWTQSMTGYCVDSVIQTGVSCGQGYTGTYNVTACGVRTGGNCACVGGTFTSTASCASRKGSGWSGTAIRTTVYTPPNCARTITWDESGCVCAASTPNGTTRWVADGSCPSGYQGTKTKEQAYSTASCSWVDTGNKNNACTCDPTPIVNKVDHPCANTTCEVSDPNDQDEYTITIDTASCTQRAATKTHNGSCKAKTFKWVDQGTTGAGVASLPPGATYVNSSCSCATFASSATQTCFYSSDPSHVIHTCGCR